MQKPRDDQGRYMYMYLAWFFFLSFSACIVPYLGTESLVYYMYLLTWKGV